MRRIQKISFVAVLLATIMNVRAAEWEKPTPPNCTLASGQSYYFYNPFTEKFVGASGMQAILEDKGLSFIFTASGDDWMMESSKGLLYADLDYVG